MILKCPSCKNLLSFSTEALQALKKAIVSCPNCRKKFGIKPLHAKCHACEQVFQYYDFKLNPALPAVACPACGAANKVPFGKYTFKRLKKKSS